MRWKVKPLPDSGDTRHGRRFALFPTRMSDEKTVVWLEWYDVVQYWSGHYERWFDRIKQPINNKCTSNELIPKDEA